MGTYTNRFFVYEGKVLRAAQPHFNTAMRYFTPDRKMMYGDACRRKRGISKIANKFLLLKGIELPHIAN